MKGTSYMLAALLFAVMACKKENKTTPATNNNNNTTTTSPYYFKFTFNDTSYNLNANFPQYMSFSANIVGGYQVSSSGFFPSMGLSFNWPVGDTVKESDVLGLAGKTFYFNSTATIQPQLEFARDAVSTDWYSNDTSNTSYYVKVTSVTFLKKDTTLGTPLRTYVITGSCAAVLSQTSANMPLTSGTFNFIISRQDN